jgi:hypothetical protein
MAMIIAKIVDSIKELARVEKKSVARNLNDLP